MKTKRTNLKKITQVINYFARKAGGIDKLKLVKLIYFADKYHLRRYGRTVTGDIYFAMKLGPVPSAVLDLLNNNIFANENSQKYFRKYVEIQKDHTIISKKEVDFEFLSESDIEAMNFVYDLFANKEAGYLVNLTHKTPEYKKHERSVQTLNRDLMDLLDFFEDSDDPVARETQKTKEEAKQVYLENLEIENFFR